jgi:hypothetical protein
MSSPSVSTGTSMFSARGSSIDNLSIQCKLGSFCLCSGPAPKDGYPAAAHGLIDRSVSTSLLGNLLYQSAVGSTTLLFWDGSLLCSTAAVRQPHRRSVDSQAFMGLVLIANAREDASSTQCLDALEICGYCWQMGQSLEETYLKLRCEAAEIIVRLLRMHSRGRSLEMASEIL